jgi:hypothetical protein
VDVRLLTLETSGAATAELGKEADINTLVVSCALEGEAVTDTVAAETDEKKDDEGTEHTSREERWAAEAGAREGGAGDGGPKRMMGSWEGLMSSLGWFR